jgi:hypothetical protein
MLILGFCLAILCDWALPSLLPECPPRLDNLFFIVGVVLIIAGLIVFALGLAGRSVGGRKFWY